MSVRRHVGCKYGKYVIYSVRGGSDRCSGVMTGPPGYRPAQYVSALTGLCGHWRLDRRVLTVNWSDAEYLLVGSGPEWKYASGT